MGRPVPILRISEEIASQLRPGSLLAQRMAWSLVTGCSEIQENSSAQRGSNESRALQLPMAMRPCPVIDHRGGIFPYLSTCQACLR